VFYASSGVSPTRAILSASIALAVVAIVGRYEACADERVFPTPVATIYPGEVIRDAMIEDKATANANPLDAGVFTSRESLLGMVAKRTLLPGRPIPLAAIDAPHLVHIGSTVRIIFEESGLVIVAYGSALQPGSVGELIRVRNQDSGLVVSGRVQADGSIRVGDG
jgi:flagellar basal body P-ring formation protein FlgA